MTKIIFNNPATSTGDIEERRFFENLNLTPQQRIKKLFELMTLSALFKKGPLKLPEGKGIVLKQLK